MVFISRWLNNPATRLLLKRLAVKAGLFLLVLILILTVWILPYALRSGPDVAAKSAVITIPRGMSLQSITILLSSQGIIREDIRFPLLARLSRYAGMIHAGEFRLETGKSPLVVLRTLALAKSIQYSITIPEGLRATEIAAIFAEGGWFDARSFANLMVDKDFMAKHGLTGVDSLEGYLYPDTYILTRDSRGAEKIMGIMIGRFNNIWAEITAKLEEKPDRQKTVILASMVEKETGTPAERPLIAGVFRNRLQLGMRLQSDPTVLYSFERKHPGTITRSDLQTVTPYNTYMINGLPAGPICSPGKESLLAVLAPAHTADLYFVSKNDGTHYFSATLAEHNSAVQKYQRKKSAETGK